MAIIQDKRQPIAAGLSVMEVHAESQAHMTVFIVKNRSEATEQFLWFFDDRATTQRIPGNTRIRWAERESEADLKVFFTSNKNRAGWKKPHFLRGNL